MIVCSLKIKQATAHFGMFECPVAFANRAKVSAEKR